MGPIVGVLWIFLVCFLLGGFWGFLGAGAIIGGLILIDKFIGYENEDSSSS